MRRGVPPIAQPAIRTRSRRSRYSAPHRRRRWLRWLGIPVLVAALAGVVTSCLWTVRFLTSVLNLCNPIAAVQQQVDPPAGSIAWKLKHGQQVNLLLLGYGGAENDAPYLTDT